MDELRKILLYGGPHDGETIEIHPHTLKVMPRITMQDEEGNSTQYGLDNHGKFVWLPDPESPKVSRGYFVCDDEGNVLSKEQSIENARKKLDDFNDESEQWKYD